MYRKQLTLSLLVAAVVSIPSSASASEHRNLCTSAAQHCTHTGPDAPLLRADVCLSSAGTLTLKGSAPCSSDAWAYYVEHGEVLDPSTNEVAAYIPLDDACSNPGMCDKGPPDGSQEWPMCCSIDGNGQQYCVSGVDCGGTLWFCYHGATNEDGTVTCFESEQSG